MKKIILIMAAGLLCACTQTIVLNSGDEHMLDRWTLNQEGTETYYDVQVPSTVAGALCDQGVFGEDLLDGLNYFDVDKSIFDKTWTYRTSFNLDKVEGQRYELVFNGLNYYADIFVNDTCVASSDTTYGVFIKRAYDVTDLLDKKNDIEVRIRRAQPRDLNIGFVDWNPRPLDESMGIIRTVKLCAAGAVSIEDVFVIPDLDVETFAEADLEVRVTLKNNGYAPVSGDIVIGIQDGGTCKVPVNLDAGQEKIVSVTPHQAANLHVDNPRVWWSYDLGSPELYDMNVQFETEGRISDTRDVTFGIRKIESWLNEHGYRQFALNGKEILLKGAGWTDDIFLRDTPESLERQVCYVKDMNMNLIRFENIWGKDDTIYDLCDRHGVLALVGWSCQWEWESYCGIPEIPHVGCIYEPKEIDLAARYFEDQVIRLHNHASVIAWMTGSDCVPIKELEQRYLDAYAKYEYRPYISSAKSLESELTGWSGSKMAGPYEYIGPDYWYLDTVNGGAFGFNTETGVGANIPQAESLRKMIPEDELWPISEYWDRHCTTSATAMNSMDELTRVINGIYGEADGFNDYVRKGHAVDYDATRAMFEAFRVNVPVSTGIVQWMLNSAWPAIYWQQYDWYGVPVAAYYGTKKACEPVQLIYNYKDFNVYAVNEGKESKDVVATVKVYDAESKMIDEQTCTLSSSYRRTVKAFDLAKFRGIPHFVSLELKDKDGNFIADNFYCIGARPNVYDWDEYTWYNTPITEFTDLRFAFSQPEADVDMKVEEKDGTYTVTLTNSSSVISYMNILKAKDSAGNMIVPAYWSDNFFPLLPGQTKTVTCCAGVKGVRIELDNGKDELPVMGSSDVFDVDVEEISGLCLNAGKSALISCGDQGVIKHISFDGKVSDILVYPADMEGITLHPSIGDLYVAIEGRQEVARVAAPEYSVFETVFPVQEAIDGNYRNGGLEGVEYYKDDILFVGSQKEANLWQYRTDGTLVSKVSLSDFATEIAGLCYEPEAGLLWVTDSNQAKIFLCTVEGRLLKTYRVPFIENLESICVDREKGCVWVASDEDSPKLYRLAFDF
ncbi:MAG: glycoside hydrolase family 2 [Bacteroidales bacterium]|nr:glycoside hydrolase family 2 [Bacteroidales bacterium]